MLLRIAAEKHPVGSEESFMRYSYKKTVQSINVKEKKWLSSILNVSKYILQKINNKMENYRNQ